MNSPDLRERGHFVLKWGFVDSDLTGTFFVDPATCSGSYRRARKFVAAGEAASWLECHRPDLLGKEMVAVCRVVPGLIPEQFVSWV